MVLEVDTIFPTDRGQDEFFLSEDEQSLRPRLAFRTTDLVLPNDTVYRNDDELFFSVETESTYEFELVVNPTYTAGGSWVDYRIAVPTGSVGRYWQTVDDKDILTTFTPKTVATGGSFVVDEDATAEWCVLKGWIKTGNIAGELNFQWAKNDTGGTTKIGEGSWVTITKL